MKKISCDECREQVKQQAAVLAQKPLPPEVAAHLIDCEQCGVELMDAIGNAVAAGRLAMEPLPRELQAPSIMRLSLAELWDTIRQWGQLPQLAAAPVLGTAKPEKKVVRAALVDAQGNDTGEEVSLECVEGPVINPEGQFGLTLATEAGLEGATVVCEVDFGAAGKLRCSGAAEKGKVTLRCSAVSAEELQEAPQELVAGPVQVPLPALRVKVLLASQFEGPA